MTKWIGIWSTAAAIVFMISSLIHAADIVTVDCSNQTTFYPPTNISDGQYWLQTFHISASAVQANKTCSFTLDARGIYALDATSVVIGDNATTVKLYGLDQSNLQYNLNSSTRPPTATGFIATRVLISVHRGATVTDDSQFNVTLAINWYCFNYYWLGSRTLANTSSWTVVDASKSGFMQLDVSGGVGVRLYVADFGGGTANQGVLIYTTLGLTDAPQRAGSSPYYKSSWGFRLPSAQRYTVYMDRRYSANRLMLVFMLDTPNTVPLYPIISYVTTSVTSLVNSSTLIMVLPRPSLAAVQLNSLQSSSDVSVVVGTPQIAGIGPVIFNSSVSQLPEWNSTLVRSRLFTILGTNLNVTLTGVDTIRVTNARVGQRGVFMSEGYGESAATTNPQSYYIDDVQSVILDNGISARTISYQVDPKNLYNLDVLSLSGPDGAQMKNYATAGYNLQGIRGSVKSTGLALRAHSASLSGYYLVRWTVGSAVGQFLPPAVLALSMVASLLLY